MNNKILYKRIFWFIDDDECVLKTDTCGVLGPEWVCKNTVGSFRCERKRCTGPNCKIQGGSRNTNVNQTTVKCLRGYEMNNKNKCIGNTNSMYFGNYQVYVI